MSDSSNSEMAIAETEPIALQQAVAGGMRTFAIVAAGQLVSILGSTLTAFGLGTWVYQQTGSVTYLGLIILAASVPGLIVSPLAGSIVDRSDRRTTMLLSNLVTCLVELALWGLIASGHGRLSYFFVLAGVISLADAFQDPAWMASVPVLVPKRLLGNASGFVQLSQGLARIIAPSLAGWMLVKVGIGPILLVDASTFFVAVATLAMVRIPRPTATDAGRAGKGSLWSEAAIGWAYIGNRAGLLALLLLSASINYLVAAVNVLYIPLVLSFAQPDVLGRVLTAGGAGLLVGSLAVIRLGTPKRKIVGFMTLVFVGGLAIAAAGLRPDPWLVGGSGCVMMCVLAVLQPTSLVLWQTKVPSDVQGRVLAFRRMVAYGVPFPLAQLTTGPLADWLFEPLLRKGGSLAPILGPWIGVGPGRGFALMFIVYGLLGSLLAVIGYAIPRIRHLESELPDMIADVKA